MDPSKEEIQSWFYRLQQDICSALEHEDGKAKFSTDKWTREGGGGGTSKVILNGNIFEKGGVNVSAVFGDLPDQIQKALQLNKSNFFATGISIVIHPKHPRVPIIHMNTRYFEIPGETWWFGGGIDLTPIYVDKEDAVFFHNKLASTCNQFDATYYPKFKKWADDYFYIKHRKETRGIGGIFFDRLNGPHSKSEIFEFVKHVGQTFTESYLPIVKKSKDKAYTDLEKKWQLLRRGRYAEFNLVYDKGTKFGLETAGRTESILMSLPPEVNWEYNHQPAKGSEERKTLDLLIKELDWTNMKP
ncbi:MAG: oxygen-dependent coproporphyrinogen oxidase [Flavobacteriales bacterium]|nr:oxygen-dependent coproporphyrinogen oxidase [Flavobacteriales bacterium]